MDHKETRYSKAKFVSIWFRIFNSAIKMHNSIEHWFVKHLLVGDLSNFVFVAVTVASKGNPYLTGFLGCAELCCGLGNNNKPPLFKNISDPTGQRHRICAQTNGGFWAITSPVCRSCRYVQNGVPLVFVWSCAVSRSRWWFHWHTSKRRKTSLWGQSWSPARWWMEGCLWSRMEQVRSECCMSNAWFSWRPALFQRVSLWFFKSKLPHWLKCLVLQNTAEKRDLSVEKVTDYRYYM